MGSEERSEGRSEARAFVAARAARVDSLVAEQYPDLSRARVQRIVERGGVTINGEVVRKSSLVAAGDRVAVSIVPVTHEQPGASYELTVLYEDEDVVAIDKPAGLATHGAPGDQGPSVAAWFVGRYPAEAGAFEAERPGIVHRLDKDTSGALVLAKAPSAQAALSASFEARRGAKTYVAVTDGVPRRAKALIDAPIARHPGDRTRMAVMKHGRESRTRYTVVGEAGEHALLEIQLETGRTHQIRVHLAAIDCAVTWDRVYGKPGPGRQLLHAWRLCVPHPGGGWLTVTAPLAADMTAAIRDIGLEQVASPYVAAVPALRE